MEPKRNTAASPTAHRTHSVGSVYSERNPQSRLSGLSFTLLAPGFPSGFCDKFIQKKHCKAASKMQHAHMALSIQDVQDMHNHFIFYLQISAVTVWIMLGISMIVMGSFWIFNMFDQKEGKCATNLYLFAYGVMSFEWIVLWLACIFYFCCSKPKGPTTQEIIETGELTGSP
ncbi:uncharacterized protein [Ranitomeya imitator]|uniref:uncharacterized protein isoform X2 n=1 Tax=Ranitomeya imitator TaxID=111125 RepID=UPI0037E83D2E